MKSIPLKPKELYAWNQAHRALLAFVPPTPVFSLFANRGYSSPQSKPARVNVKLAKSDREGRVAG